jgi:hypothetical protein
MPVPGFHDRRAPNFDDVIAVNFDRQLHSAAGVRYGLTLVKTNGTSKSDLSSTIGTKIIVMNAMNSVTPKAAAKHDFLFNEPASDRWCS